MNGNLLVLAAALTLTAASAAAAQDPVRPGGTVEGVLEASDTLVTAGEVARLVPVDAPVGTKLAVSLESADFDAYAALVVVDEAGGLLVIDENDDAAGLASGTDARVRGLIQPDRSYAVWVGSYDGAGTGAFRLTGISPEPGEAFPVPAPPGSDVRGVLDGDDPVDEEGRPYEIFEVYVGPLTRIMALADGPTSPSVRLDAPESGPVAWSTDLDGLALLDRTVETAGSYRVVVTATDGRGPFRVRIWTPSMTAAERAGLVVDDSLLSHPEMGFQMPSPGPGFTMGRSVDEPWGRDFVGDYRIWMLEDTVSESVRQVTILWVVTLGRLDGTLMTSQARGMAQELAAAFGPGTPIRSKPTEGEELEYRATIRPVGVSTSSSIRCIGEPGDGERRGRMLCAIVVSESSYPGGQRLLDGMVIR